MSTQIEITARMALVGGQLARRGDVVDASAKVAARLISAGGAKAVSTEVSGDGEPLPVVIEVDGQDVDLSTISDPSELRDIASKIGLEIPGNVRKVETLVERIVAHKATSTEVSGDG